MCIIHSYISFPLYMPSQSIVESSLCYLVGELVISYLYFVWQCVCVCLNLPFVPFNPLHEFHCCWFMSCHIWNSPPRIPLKTFFSFNSLLLMNFFYHMIVIYFLFHVAVAMFIIPANILSKVKMEWFLLF